MTQQEQKKWSAKFFQMSIAKHLGLKTDSHDRTNNVHIRFYDLGENAEQYFQGLKDKKLYSSFLFEVWPILRSGQDLENIFISYILLLL